MNVRPKLVVAWLMGVGVLMAPTTNAAPPARPNFVVMVADDMRWDAMGCEGNRIARTPNLDRLAADGVRFANSFTTTAICAISRAGFFTGQFESRHGIRDFSTPLSPTAFAEAYPAQLKKAGYRVGVVGKWGVGDQLPKNQFDYWKGFGGQGRYFEKPGGDHLTDRMGDQAIEFLGCCSPDQPFALQISFKAPHEQDGDLKRPFPPASRFESLFADVQIPIPETSLTGAFSRMPKILRESEGRVRWEKCFGTPDRYQQSVKDYHRLVAGVDDVVGRVRQKLQEMGFADNTVIVFTSDNGFCLADHGLQGKWFMYEESIRVPLIVSDPRSKEKRPTKVVAAPVLNIDVAPTILDLAKIPIPSRMQGRSLSPWIIGLKPESWRRDWFYEHHFVHPGIPQSEGVRGEKWKYVRYVANDPLVEQLFDLQADPKEVNDLSTDARSQPVLAELRQRWRQLRADAR